MYIDMRVQRLNAILCYLITVIFHNIRKIMYSCFRYGQIVLFGRTIDDTCFCLKNKLSPVLQVGPSTRKDYWGKLIYQMSGLEFIFAT